MADGSGLGQRARYDEFSEWYIRWVVDSPGLVCDSASGMMPARLEGERWLDVACGVGRTSRELARRGASVVGVDISAELIAKARSVEEAEPLAIHYAVGDIARWGDWWDWEPFDGAVCEMAFMDIDDLDGTVAAVAAVLRAEARFVASFVNPCFPGNEQGLSSWPPDRGYAAEGFWTSPDHNPDGVRIRVGSNHRTLSTYLNTLIDAGFVVERAFEPRAVVPYWLVLACHRR